MKYIINYIDKTPVYIAVSFEAGGMFQPKNKLGVSHLTEHILANNNLNSQYKIGAQTEDRFISFFSQILNPSQNNIEEAIINLHKIIYNFTITKEKLDDEIKAIKNELTNFSYDYPNTNQVILHDNLFSSLKPIMNNEIISGNTKNPAKELSLYDINLFIKNNLTYPYQIIITGNFDIKVIATLFDKYFKNTFIQSKSEIIRKKLPQKTITIIDPTKNTNISEIYYGIGWAIKNANKKETVALLISFRALANSDNNLYKKLRDKHNLIYNFSSDSSCAGGQLNLSLHTTFSNINYSIITDIIMSFIFTKKSLKSAIDRQLEFERSAPLTLTDGSKTTYSNQYFFSRFDLTIEDYINYLDILQPDYIIEIFNRHINSNNATILIS